MSDLLVEKEESRTEGLVASHIENLRDAPQAVRSRKGEKFNVYASDHLLPVEAAEGQGFKVLTMGDRGYWAVQFKSEPTILELVDVIQEFSIGGYEVFAILKDERDSYYAYWLEYIP